MRGGKKRELREEKKLVGGEMGWGHHHPIKQIPAGTNKTKITHFMPVLFPSK